MDRLISLTVGTKEAEEWFRTFQEISEIAKNLGESHRYVSVTSSVIDEDDKTETDPNEGLVYDENTLSKIHRVLATFVGPERSFDVINQLQNAGILFRERR